MYIFKKLNKNDEFCALFNPETPYIAKSENTITPLINQFSKFLYKNPFSHFLTNPLYTCFLVLKENS